MEQSFPKGQMGPSGHTACDHCCPKSSAGERCPKEAVLMLNAGLWRGYDYMFPTGTWHTVADPRGPSVSQIVGKGDSGRPPMPGAPA